MNNLAEVIKFERPVVKADIDQGFDRIAGTLTDTLANPPVNLSGREYRVINAIISKTYRYHKKADWIASVQLAEMTGIDKGNVSKIKTALVRKKVLLQEGRKIGINPIVSEWEDEPKTQKAVKNDCNKDSQKRLLTQSNSTRVQSKTTIKTVESNPHNRKTILQKTTNTIDKPTRRKSQIPQDFLVTEQMKKWATENQIPVDLKTETEQFIDYHTAKGEAKLDWTACWRTWMRNSKKFSANKNQFKTKAKPENFDRTDYGQSTFTGDF